MTERNYHFKCPKCNGSMKVKNRKHKGRFVIIRYRVCDTCGERRTTAERFQQDKKAARELEKLFQK